MLSTPDRPEKVPEVPQVPRPCHQASVRSTGLLSLVVFDPLLDGGNINVSIEVETGSVLNEPHLCAIFIHLANDGEAVRAFGQRHRGLSAKAVCLEAEQVVVGSEGVPGGHSINVEGQDAGFLAGGFLGGDVGSLTGLILFPADV